jgi:hypothetical protein
MATVFFCRQRNKFITMNKKTSVARVLLREKLGLQVEYGTLEDLCASVNEILSEIPQYADTTVITLPDGKSYQWIAVYAHYCYGKGRITETQLVNEIFKEGGES